MIRAITKLKRNEFKPDISTLRGVRASERFDRVWDVLSRAAGDIIQAFKKEIAG